MKFDQQFWDEKYRKKLTGWDIGYVSTPIKEYVDQLEDKSLKILIPGGGNSYEAEYLFRNGFSNVYVMDISAEPLKNIQFRIPDFPISNLLHQDFFKARGQYDLIFEQTLFCAIDPAKRMDYVKKMSELLKPERKLVGLLFQIPLNDDHPPFGGNRKEYEKLFKDKFEIQIMETAYNSIPPRAGNELFIKMKKK